MDFVLSYLCLVMKWEQSPENSKVSFGESESLKENVNRCVGAFYLSHHELLMDEFRRILNEKCTGCQTNDRNQFAHELCFLASVLKWEHKKTDTGS